MTDHEILTAMKEMFTEERKLTDTKIDTLHRDTNARIDAMHKDTAEKLQATDARIDAMHKDTTGKLQAANAKIDAMHKDTAEKLQAADARIDAMHKDTAEKLQAADAKIESLRQSTDAKIDAAQKETIQQIKVLLENGVEKQIQLLAEGHAQILARLPEAEEQENLKGRVTTLEHIASEHTKQINELRRAQ
jgi:hypothetical protein